MTFKKDYINYLLYTVVNSNESEFRDNYRLKKLVDSIMAVDDMMKATYLVGKTAGLETLFKYMLYVSDKIDKSQVTVFTLKNNFEYDVKNLTKICSKISSFKSENVHEVIENIASDTEEIEPDEAAVSLENAEDVNDNAEAEEIKEFFSADEVTEAEAEETANENNLTLIENRENITGGTEVFELESISDTFEESNDDADEQVISGEISEDEKTGNDKFVYDEAENIDDTVIVSKENIPEDEEITESEKTLTESTDTEEHIEKTEETIAQELPEIEIEVHKPSLKQDEEHVKEEAITNEAYYKFETKFFEEVKILEKLFAAVEKDTHVIKHGKLSEKCLQCLTEIIEITSELSSLSRQLSFDLTADIFLTMNLYFAKAISQPDILRSERIKLFDSALALVNSLIKGEDYLNYDSIVDKMESLKLEISRQEEEKFKDEEISEQEPESTPREPISPPEEVIAVEEKPAIKQTQMDSAVFKLKYLVKEFEKSFLNIGKLHGEYSKFDALEKINELNNALRMIAKISAIVKLNEVLKLAEVTYVFLKYVKDYRMDLMEPEIKQIVKYIIFTFKMLLTNRKPEDFNVLVQHLNNPVKIFADS